MGKGIVYSIGTEGCPCCGCRERTVGCHGTCERYKAWDGKRQAEKLERFRRTSILHEADKRKKAAVEIIEGEEGRYEQGDFDGETDTGAGG